MFRTLDVGCGCSPRGDVNVDLMLPGSDLKWDQNPQGFKNFVRAAAEFLPFQNGSFDLVFSSHLLEHLEDPDLAVKEFLRVSSCQVQVIVPFWLFSIFDVFATGRKFGAHVKWLRQNHKHVYLMDPLKTGSFRMRFINVLDAALYKKKRFGSLIRFPVPFETETVIVKGVFS